MLHQMSMVNIWPKFFSVDLICLQTVHNVASLAEPPTNWVVYYVWRWIDLLLSSNKSQQTQPTIYTIKSPILEFVTTGTPAGVGMGKKPQLNLKAGDIMNLEIECLGKQEQKVH